MPGNWFTATVIFAGFLEKFYAQSLHVQKQAQNFESEIISEIDSSSDIDNTYEMSRVNIA